MTGVCPAETTRSWPFVRCLLGVVMAPSRSGACRRGAWMDSLEAGAALYDPEQALRDTPGSSGPARPGFLTAGWGPQSRA